MKFDRANVRLLAGLAMLPALLFQESLGAQFLQVAYAVMLALMYGRRFKLGPNLIVLLSVTAAHVFQPNGLHLLNVFSFPVTAGALLIGVRKALTLIGMLYLSQFMVTGKPRLPGRLGALLSLQFTYFDRITKRWEGFDKRHPLASLDTLLLSFDHTEEGLDAGGAPVVAASQKEIAATLLHIACMWLLFTLGTTGWLKFIEAWAY